MLLIRVTDLYTFFQGKVVSDADPEVQVLLIRQLIWGSWALGFS